MFGHLLHLQFSQEEYEALTMLEIDEFRQACKDINKANGGR